MPTHHVVPKSDLSYRSSPAWKVGLIALSVALLMSFTSFFNAPHARAASLSPIGWTNSYYVDSAMANMNHGNLQQTFANWGSSEASNDNAVAKSHGSCANGQYVMYVIIDFGQPTSTNIITFGSAPNQTWSQATGITLAYANAWYNVSINCFRLHLVLGVNNNVCFQWASVPNTDPCDPAAGTALAQAVESANSSLAASGQSWQVDVSGGIDAESDAGFGSYSTTLRFVNAYNQTINGYATKYQLYDFGDATHSCNLDWACDPTSQIYNIAWGIGFDYPFPEAYSNGQNSNWLEVSRFSSSNPIRYRVALLDASQGNAANQATWQDFVNKNGAWSEGSVLAGSAQLPLA